MKVMIPENLKADIPPTMWGRILSATPVVMAVVATMLAGLATSEMTRAQYDRSLAAQQQSKAGDQWSFFQAKKLRGALQRNTIDLLQAAGEIHPLDAVALKSGMAVDAPAGEEALGYLTTGQGPRAVDGPALDPKIKAALEAVENARTESEIVPVLKAMSSESLAAALRAARDQTTAFDAQLSPVNRVVEQLEQTLTQRKDAGLRDFIAARLRFTAQRYDVEARLNQRIASLYELQVRQSNISAERHHARAKRFSFGMLAAQAGVIIGTFAIAARKRNLLWSIAAAAGLLAVAFGVYVYLWV